MPSTRPLPTLTELLDAYGAPIVGREDPDGDLREGATYDLLAGVAGLAMSRIAASDRDKFRACYYGTAEREDLDTLRSRRGMSPRVQDAPGTGTAYLQRVSNAAGGETVYVGTRFAVWPATSIGPRLVYSCRTDTTIGATDLTAQIPIQSEATGPNTVIDTNDTTNNGFAVVDALKDPTWKVTRIVCGAGTNREKDEELRARDQRTRHDQRKGYAQLIIDTMTNAGAGSVALFGSDFRAVNPVTGIESVGALDAGGYGDVGLNYVLVGRSDYTAPFGATLRNCRIAIDRCAVAGTSVQVLPMSATLVTMTVTLRLWDVPEKYATDQMAAETKQAIMQYFSSRDNPFRFRTSVIRGAILHAARDAQQVSFTTSPAEPAITSLFQTSPVPRYYVTSGSITVNITA